MFKLVNPVSDYPTKITTMELLLAKPAIYAIVAFVFLVLFVLGVKTFYMQSIKAKVKEYQSEIARSHSRILKLEVQNEKLQKRIQELEHSYPNVKIA